VEYVVVSAAGTVVARVSVPAGVKLVEIGSDYVLGVAKDRDDVESIVMYGLRRG
jgi:hypothetical protein